MTTPSPVRQLGLVVVVLATVGLFGWLTATPTSSLYAAVSPLATPWPTLVVTYPAVLPTITPLLAPMATAVRVNFVFHSPLPTPTPLPDVDPPQTALQVAGVQGGAGWYRSPVSMSFTITDNLGAGVTTYQLDNAPSWSDREYYYPALALSDDGIHTLTYFSIDRRHNREAPQSAELRIDRTPPQTDAPAMDGNQLLNGWYNTSVLVTLGGSDALSGLAGFEQQALDTSWLIRPASFALATTGAHALTWRAVDNAGNVSAAQQTTVQIDVTPPTTTYSLDAFLVNGWYSRPLTVTLSAVDLGAGLFQTQYRRNGEPSWQSYGAPFAVNQPGVQLVNYQSTDRALNVESPHTLTLPLDLAPPALDLAVSRPPATGNWYSGQLTVTAQASDGEAGLASLEYTLDGGGWQPYSAPLPFTTGALRTLRLRATDRVGHQAVSNLLQLGVDTQPPTTTVQLSQAPTAAGWFSAPVTVTLPSIDTQTGVLHTQYRLNNANGWQTYVQPLVVSQEGYPTLAYYAIDQALNAETVHTLTLPIDLVAPTLNTSISPTQTSHGWYRQAVSVTFQAQDTLAGLGSLHYTLDDTAWQPYSGPLTVRSGRVHSLQFRALDRAGHAATTDLLTLGVDGQPPTTTLHLSQPPNGAGWLNQPVTLTLVATDTETGVFQTQYQWQNQPSPTVYQQPMHLTQEGNASLTWFSIDRALNQEQPHTQTFKLDLTAPVVTYTLTGGGPLGAVAPGWYQTAATAQITASDALAGVAQVEVALDGANWQPYQPPLTIRSGGRHTLQVRARDLADNLSTPSSLAFGIDTLAPVSTLWLEGGRAPNGWYVTPVTVTLTTTDTGAGVATGQWRLNGGLWQPYSAPFVVDSQRVNLVEYYAVDKAGNQEVTKFTVFSLDLADPASQAVVLQGRSGTNGWYVALVSLTLNGQDQESGLSNLEYSINGQPWQRYLTPVELASEGVQRINYRAVDASGRVEATHTLTVALDFTPPQIQTTLPEQIVDGNMALTPAFTVIDAVSGILTTTLLLNGQPYQPAQPLPVGANIVEVSAVNGAGLSARLLQTITVVGRKVYLPVLLAQMQH